jgi:metal-responsive CopG/Arc/MetJ family transcriptional regulator
VLGKSKPHPGQKTTMHILLTPVEVKALDELVEVEGVSRSDVVRLAIRKRYQDRTERKA